MESQRREDAEKVGAAGQSMQGDWTLRVVDAAPVDTGSLDKWSLVIMPAL